MADPERGGVSMAELALAARNHGLPLEALRYDVTPVGLHYLLTHYDIPAIDPDGWSLRVDGGAGASRQLSLDELRAMPAVTRRATMECAGNGRALLEPRPVEPAMVARGGGDRRVDRRPRRRRAGAGDRRPRLRRCRVHRRRPGCRARRRAVLRPQPAPRDRDGTGRPARLRAQRRAPAAPARRPAAAGGGRLVRHDQRQVAHRDRRVGHAVHRLPAGRVVPTPPARRRTRGTGDEGVAAGAA